MASKKKPSGTQLVKDVHSALKKHKFSGTMIVKPVAVAAMDGGGGCAPGKTPHEISFQRPDGTWVSKIICI